LPPQAYGSRIEISDEGPTRPILQEQLTPFSMVPFYEKITYRNHCWAHKSLVLEPLIKSTAAPSPTRPSQTQRDSALATWPGPIRRLPRRRHPLVGQARTAFPARLVNATHVHYLYFTLLVFVSRRPTAGCIKFMAGLGRIRAIEASEKDVSSSHP
jgi:hypothetical protein